MDRGRTGRVAQRRAMSVCELFPNGHSCPFFLDSDVIEPVDAGLMINHQRFEVCSECAVSESVDEMDA